MAKISIKIFTDYKDSDQSSVWPMRFCPIRKYFFFPIPKTKFVLAKKNNKIVNFNFVHNGNIFYCDCYKIIDFNEIDFYLVSSQHKSGSSLNFKSRKINTFMLKDIKIKTKQTI